MKNFNEWLINKLPFLVPFQDSHIISGSYDFSMKMDVSFGSNNPLNIFLQSSKKNNESSVHNIHFSLSGSLPELQFVKRIRNTPFFISSLTCAEYSLYIIDFYEWVPETTIYRIFYFQSIHTDNNLEINLLTQHEQLNSGMYKIDDYYLSFLNPVSGMVKGSTLKISNSPKGNPEDVLIMSFSEKENGPLNVSMDSLLKRLNHLIVTADKNHILNDIKIQNKKKRHRIDELWSGQKGLHPDRAINKYVLDDNFSNHVVLLWTIELARYMGWENIIETRVKNKYLDLCKKSGKNFQEIYDAYFNTNENPDKIIELLQSWWNQYSLPLYQMKLEQDLQVNPSAIFIIFSLAMQMKLPWYKELYRLCDFFRQEPQIELLAHLIQLVVIRNGEKDTIEIVPGPEPVGNIKQIKRGETEYRYTQFGKVRFTSLYLDNVKRLKFDKEVIINHNKTGNQIKIIPNIIPAELNRFRTNNILIQPDKNSYQVPLIWKKADLTIPGCRIRWIFKKDRFQLTCQPDKNSKLLKIDKNVIDLNEAQKITYYHPMEKSKNTAILKLFEYSGRSFFINPGPLEYKAQIVGWIQDRYGLVVDHLNLRLNSQHSHCHRVEAGILNLSFSASSKFDSLRLFTKKMENLIPIRKIENRVFNKLLTYSHRGSDGILLIIIDDQINTPKDVIQQMLLKYLGFLPLVLYKSEVKKNLNTEYLILVENTDVLYRIEKNKKYSNSSVLTINYPEGIQKLFSILSDQHRN